MDRRSFLRTTGAVAGAATLAPLVGAKAANALTHSNPPSGPISELPDVGAAETTAGSNLPLASLNRGNRDQVTSTLNPWSPPAGGWGVHTINHLYRRAGVGATMAEVNAAMKLTPSQAVDKLLDDSLTTGAKLPAPPNHSDQWLQKPPYLGSDQVLANQQQTDFYYAAMSLRRQVMTLAASNDVSLRENMVMFWANHFVVEYQKVYYPQSLYGYLDYFRQHPWGNFKQMVKDVTIMPAMLIYLDGNYSNFTKPNENYGRELMELFTLGVTDKDGNPNYSETDIQEMAKALTGWYVDTTAQAPNVLPAVYNVNLHNSAPKQPFASAGAPKKQYGLASSGKVQDDVIDCMFQYKADAIAWYICSKLYMHFVYWDISSASSRAIIQQMADAFKVNWELKPIISMLLKSEHFFDEANIGADLKGPIHYMLGMIRSMGVPVTDLLNGSLWYYGYIQGQSLLDPPNVKGWPGHRAWISTTTIAQRNLSFTAAFINTLAGIPAYSATGYGENDTGAVLDDATLNSWGAQFPDYKSDITQFIAQVSDFLCAVSLSPAALARILSATQIQTYEWGTLADADRAKVMRRIVYTIMTIAEYQLC